jgi:hypothetical protein
MWQSQLGCDMECARRVRSQIPAKLRRGGRGEGRCAWHMLAGAKHAAWRNGLPNTDCGERSPRHAALLQQQLMVSTPGHLAASLSVSTCRGLDLPRSLLADLSGARPLSMTMARARPGWQSPVSTRAAGHGVMACDRLPAASCGIQQQGTVSFAAGRFSKPNSSVPSMRRCAFEPSFAAGHFFPSRETAPAAASINWRRCCGTFINMVANGACSARSIVLVLQRTLIGLTLDISNA